MALQINLTLPSGISIQNAYTRIDGIQTQSKTSINVSLLIFKDKASSDSQKPYITPWFGELPIGPGATYQQIYDALKTLKDSPFFGAMDV